MATPLVRSGPLGGVCSWAMAVFLRWRGRLKNAAASKIDGSRPKRFRRPGEKYQIAVIAGHEVASPLSLQLPFEPLNNHRRDVLRRLAGRAAHVRALRVDARRFRGAVLHEQIDVVDRRLVVELAVDAEDRRRRLVEQPESLQRQARRGFEKLLERLGAHGAAARFEQAVRAEEIRRAAGGESRDQPFLLKAVMDIAAVEYRALDALGSRVGKPRRPIGAETAAPNADAAAVDLGALRQMIEPREECAFRCGIAVEHRIFAAARHVDGEGSKALLYNRLGDA